MIITSIVALMYTANEKYPITRNGNGHTQNVGRQRQCGVVLTREQTQLRLKKGINI